MFASSDSASEEYLESRNELKSYSRYEQEKVGEGGVRWMKRV